MSDKKISELINTTELTNNDIFPIVQNNLTKKIKWSDIRKTMNLSDEYDNTLTYSVGDYCIYNNTLYRCTTAISTAEAWDVTHWTETNIDEEIKNIDNAKIEKPVDITATGQNCNDYKSSGIYTFMTANALPSNSPASGMYGWLQVIANSNSSTVRQIWHRHATQDGIVEYETYIRELKSNVWSNWKKVTMGEIFGNADQTIPTNSDLNNYVTPGTYRCATGTIAATLTNAPTTNVGFKLVVECTSGAERYRQTVYANRISGDLTYVRHYNGSWGNWYKFDMTQV